MLRRLRDLAALLALFGLGALITSCGNDHAKVRFVQGSPDALNVDIAVDGKTVATDVPFGSVSPATDYLTVTAGNRRVEVRDAGTTTDRINAIVGLASQRSYTLLAVGKVNPAPSDPPADAIAALLKTDDNSAPPSGNIKLRVIHAAVDGPSGIDIFVVAPGTDITNLSPTIAALPFQQASDYLNLTAATYEVIMTDSNDPNHATRFFDQTYTLAAGQNRTLVTLDAGGGFMSALELSDLN